MTADQFGDKRPSFEELLKSHLALKGANNPPETTEEVNEGETEHEQQLKKEILGILEIRQKLEVLAGAIWGVDVGIGSTTDPSADIQTVLREMKDGYLLYHVEKGEIEGEREYIPGSFGYSSDYGEHGGYVSTPGSVRYYPDERVWKGNFVGIQAIVPKYYQTHLGNIQLGFQNFNVWSGFQGPKPPIDSGQLGWGEHLKYYKDYYEDYLRRTGEKREWSFQGHNFFDPGPRIIATKEHELSVPFQREDNGRDPRVFPGRHYLPYKETQVFKLGEFLYPDGFGVVCSDFESGKLSRLIHTASTPARDFGLNNNHNFIDARAWGLNELPDDLDQALITYVIIHQS